MWTLQYPFDEANARFGSTGDSPSTPYDKIYSIKHLQFPRIGATNVLLLVTKRYVEQGNV